MREEGSDGGEVVVEAHVEERVGFVENQLHYFVEIGVSPTKRGKLTVNLKRELSALRSDISLPLYATPPAKRVLAISISAFC
jgi:hypothetical protein